MKETNRNPELQEISESNRHSNICVNINKVLSFSWILKIFDDWRQKLQPSQVMSSMSVDIIWQPHHIGKKVKGPVW